MIDAIPDHHNQPPLLSERPLPAPATHWTQGNLVREISPHHPSGHDGLQRRPRSPSWLHLTLQPRQHLRLPRHRLRDAHRIDPTVDTGAVRLVEHNNVNAEMLRDRTDLRVSSPLCIAQLMHKQGVGAHALEGHTLPMLEKALTLAVIAALRELLVPVRST